MYVCNSTAYCSSALRARKRSNFLSYAPPMAFPGISGLQARTRMSITDRSAPPTSDSVRSTWERTAGFLSSISSFTELATSAGFSEKLASERTASRLRSCKEDFKSVERSWAS